MIVDFHSHTLKSDGTSTPAEVYAMMVARKVEFYAVTDHDTLAAYPELPEDDQGPKRIVGIEINTVWKGDDVHILGYNLPSKPSAIDDELERHRQARAARMQTMVDKLRAAGIEITVEDVLTACSDTASLGRPHIAKVLVQRGLADNIEDAFARYLRRGCPAFVEAERVTPFDAIRMIKEVDGVPILAHPGRLKDSSLVDEIAVAGIEGIEVFYGTHTPEQTEAFRHAADHYGLMMSAGADFHDAAWTPWGVGMHVDERDMHPFLRRLGCA